MAVGDYKNSVIAFEKAVDLNNSNSVYYNWLGNAFGNRINEVNMLSKMKMAGKIKSSYERAIELDPQNIDPKWGLMQFHTNAPSIAGGDKKTAEELAGEIKKIDPKRGYSAYMQFYRATKKYDMLKKVIDEAIASDPDDMDYMSQLAAYYNDNNEPGRAVEIYRKVLKANPGNVQAAYQLGYLCVNMKEYDMAFDIFEDLINREEIDVGALYQYGRVSAISGDRLDKGIQYMQEYMKHEPTQGNPTHAAAFWRLGLIYEHKGDLEAAIKSMEKSLELDPKYKSAKDDLKRIKEKKY